MVERLFPHEGDLSVAERQKLRGGAGRVIWFTGLSGSGKSTVAFGVESALLKSGVGATILDADSVRLGLCKGLDFSLEGRSENLRRVAHAAALMADSGLVVLCAFVSPLEAQRALVREIVSPLRFDLVYVDASLELCESRDPKGLYAQARAGHIKDFTGVSSPYETPVAAEVRLDAELSLKRLIDTVIVDLF